ncbi:hypothetical protein HK099_008153 [Clydaea vesicula]|uniref:Pyridoxamine 5'-phosphate oxidase Alr4036 family FMN-binding domain-containing protein n=1 Tax=Clydaea vesicula TaxID=447962 RepID=A0AAD5TZ47_9FUNG|nr:hypothetical protein HK099_008153 [Clydaea vesicula]KAJ3388892.1 hypothetical protein HDU92_001311 [Lobulomyces angularis]
MTLIQSLNNNPPSHLHINHPPWKPHFQNALNSNNKFSTNVIVTAVNSQTGKPVSKNLTFTGFHSGLHTKKNPSAPGNPNVVGKIKLEGLMQFAVDTRGIKDWFGIPKHNDNERFVDVSWFFGQTQQQFRCSGKVFLVATPNSFDPPSSIPPWAPKDIDWEEERKYLWKTLPQKRKFSNVFPEDELNKNNGKLFNLGGITIPINSQHSETLKSSSLTATDDSLEEIDVPDNFGLLLVDIDYVDEMSLEEPTSKTVYQVKVPLRTYGRVSGCEWEEKVEVSV